MHTNAQETAVPTPVPGTEMVVANEISAAKALAVRLPAKYRDEVLLMQRPSSEDLVDIVAKLDPETQKKVMGLVSKTRPRKQGAHTNRTGFSPTDIKLYHGTGNDPLRPRNCQPGDFYTAESKALASPFEAAVIGFYYGRTLWPAKDAEGATKVPLCSSYNREHGSRYGACSECPSLNKKWNEGGCGKEVVFYLVDRELTGIYLLRFAKTSCPAGESLAKIITKGDQIYDRWIRFESQERNDDKKNARWFVLKAGPAVDPKKADLDKVPENLFPLFHAFSTIIDSDVYYPALAQSYTPREDNAAAANGADAAGDTLNLEEMKNGATSTDAPDYSA